MRLTRPLHFINTENITNKARYLFLYTFYVIMLAKCLFSIYDLKEIIDKNQVI